MMKKKVMAATMTACTAVATTACDSSKTDETTAATNNEAADGVLTMATNAEFPPCEYHDGGETVGINVEITRVIAEKIGMTLEVGDIAFDSITPEVQSGKTDINAADMTVSEDRLQNVDSSDPYTISSQTIITQNDSEIAGPDDLADKTIGVQPETTDDIYVSDYEEQGLTVKHYSRGSEVIQVMMQGRINAMAIGQEPAKVFISESEDIKILDETLTVGEHIIAIKKGNTELVEKANSTPTELKDPGEPQKIIDEYISAG